MKSLLLIMLLVGAALAAPLTPARAEAQAENTAGAGAVSVQTFTLSQIVFDPSSYLNPEQLQEVADQYTRRPISFDDLMKMIKDIKRLYIVEGVPTAEPVLPPQEIRNGVLHVALVEAKVESVQIEGFPRTKPSFLRDRLTLPVNEKPDFDAIASELRVFDLSYDIQPSLKFSPGTAPGTTIATIYGESPKRFAVTLSADNYGRPETGRERASLFARWSSVTGVRDALSFQAQMSKGASAYSLGYSRPIGPKGGVVTAAISHSNSSIIGGEFTPVQITSDSTDFTLNYRRPFRIQPDRYFTFEGGFEGGRDKSKAGPLSFSDISLGEVYAIGRYYRQWPKARASFGLGVRIGRADAEGTSETEGSYQLLYGDAGFSTPLGEALQFDATANFQFAPGQNLPVSRLITAGGVGSVRGYPSEVRGGDSGVVLNLQISKREPFSWMNGRLNVRPFAFVDAAVVVPYRASGGFDSDQDVLASVGVGAVTDLNKRVALLTSVGVPLKETLGFTDVGKPTVYIGLDYKF
ncbi:ShlB/FhaC/HecB family hemolysin secretion/activation protein [Celeribacter sp.]|uniref:ShlB/FhaC/HecB family hemolysin secretion/activation protein n=1 Tax=Celeribacter sp. TaxID=1890673 RepID=UPI003A912645